jgi:predicted nucleic acid-binding protein
MILLDSNIAMYLIGSEHPHKHDARRLLEQAAERGERLVTDAEVFQEILHRFHAIRRRDAIDAAFELLEAMVDEVLPVDLATVLDARTVMSGHSELSARDAVHVAAMRRAGVERIMSFDPAFDQVEGVTRLH